METTIRKDKNLIPHEVGMIAAILADVYLKTIYEREHLKDRLSGYLGVVDLISTISQEIEKETRNVEEWEEWLDKNEPKCACWDDYIIKTGGDKLSKLLGEEIKANF